VVATLRTAGLRTPAGRSVACMQGGRYSVDIEFEAEVPPKSMGRNVSRLETFLPASATVRLAKEKADEGLIEVEVVLPAGTPAMALRDVVRAVEMVTITPGGLPVDDPIGDLRRARVTRVGDAPEWNFERTQAEGP
jgi:hypothetical protein